MKLCEKRLGELGFQIFRAARRIGPFAAAIVEVDAVSRNGEASKYIYKQPPSDRRNEIELHQNLGDWLSGWAPQVAAAFTDEPRALLTRYAGEPVLDRFQAAFVPEKKRWLSLIVSRLARLHAETLHHAEGWVARGLLPEYPFSGKWAEWACNQLLRLQGAAMTFDYESMHEEIAEIAESFYPVYASALRCPAVLTHGDPHMGNIVGDERHLNFIDWEWSTAATPLRDLAVVMQDVEEEELVLYAMEAYIEALLAFGYPSSRTDLLNDYYPSMLDNTMMMAAWDIELFFMGLKHPVELEGSLHAKMNRIRSSWARLGEG